MLSMLCRQFLESTYDSAWDVEGADLRAAGRERAVSQEPAGSEIRPYQHSNLQSVGTQRIPPVAPFAKIICDLQKGSLSGSLLRIVAQDAALDRQGRLKRRTTIAIRFGPLLTQSQALSHMDQFYQ